MRRTGLSGRRRRRRTSLGEGQAARGGQPRVPAGTRASFSWSERRACRALGFSRSSHRYSSRREEPRVLLDQLRAHAAARPRFGYRRLHLLLRRDGVVVNHKRVYRLYRLEGLSVRTKRRKRMAAAPRTVLPAGTPTGRAPCW
ncbi:MAG: transposase [Myxococcaceae bacterium]|nr:MAG: transposase [Myxococcaceae bacterium]